MKAVYYLGVEQMEVRDIPVPSPKEDEYLIKIHACGVCGSDVEGFLGKTGRRIEPMIMGHECAGVIEKAPINGKYKAGESVAIFPKLFCGECENCKSGRANLCANGEFLGVLTRDGAMTEYIALAEQYLIPYSGIGADIASLAEPAAVSYNGVFKLSDDEIAASNNILVVGAGTIGIMALLWLKYRGARRVTVSDATNFRLELAKQMGADEAINTVKEDFLSKAQVLTNGAMFDISIEAVGISATALASIEALKMAGRSIWIGNAAKMVSVDMQHIVTRELNIQGNYIYSFEDFTECVRLLSAKAIDPKPLITHHMEMSEGDKAFYMLKNNEGGKAVKIVLENK